MSAGRDTGSRSFERRHLAEHLHFGARALAADARTTHIRLTELDDASGPVIEQARATLAGTPGLQGSDALDRMSGGGYYTTLCFKVDANVAGLPMAISDGGFTN